jgi:UDP-glucose 4-epimerase
VPVRIFVTGGAGFVGSHLCDRLITDGHAVTAVDNFSTGMVSSLVNLKSIDYFILVEGSILDADLLSSLINEADYVFHLAAAIGVFNFVNNPLASPLTNMGGTENALKASRSAKTPAFLTSSIEVYGKNISDSLKEGDDRILGSPVTLR